MTRYEKGANFERELVAKFWEHGWASMRAAGSGTTSFPVPDVIGIKDNKIIIVECKTTKKDRLSLKKDILALKKFSGICNGNAYIAIKFYKKGPRFFDLNKLLSKGDYTITIHDQFLDLESILGKQKTL
ncbi:MAG: hypothetical protein DRO76_01350 [Candidatus Altiarchaeales archaeon]|nr:MAG: hypothetical protein DRO76_01350 [Candidatus Altiarchaeales archaeon]